MRPMLPAAFLLATLFLLACAQSPGAPSDDRRRMPIETVEVLHLESLPVQYTVRIDGYLPDSCWGFDSLKQERSGRTFTIEVLMRRTAPADAVCLQVIEPVQRNVPLGSLPAGEYTVDVNGAVQVTFQAG